MTQKAWLEKRSLRGEWLVGKLDIDPGWLEAVQHVMQDFASAICLSDLRPALEGLMEERLAGL